jgi:hypothetical protein
MPNTPSRPAITSPTTSASVSYLLAELRCASLRARLWQADIDAITLALEGGLITADQALELLHDCDALHLVGVREEAAT